MTVLACCCSQRGPGDSRKETAQFSLQALPPSRRRLTIIINSVFLNAPSMLLPVPVVVGLDGW